MGKKVIVQTHWTKKMLKVKRASWSDGTASSSITCCDLCLEGNSEQKMHDKSCHQRSDQISRSVVSDSLQPHESQHARPPCPSPTPGVHWDSHPSTQWCHPAISPSVVPFSSWPQSLPASESFPMSQLFTWRGQSTGVSALASFFQRNPRADLLQNGLVGSPCSPRDSQESSPTPQFKSINSS